MNNLKYEQFYKRYIGNEYKINGKDMTCICPFHEEKTASMHIDLVKGGFHCFGCEAHGNAKEFLEKLKEKSVNVIFTGEQIPNVSINTMFDNILYAEKPKGEEIGKIKNRIENQLAMKDYTLNEFISNFAKGITIIPAGIKGQAELNWKGQQVFLLDFDNKNENHLITVEEIINYCNQIGMTPTCVYHTFSSSEEINKFRIVYVFKEIITDYQTAQIIIHSLLDKFKQFSPDTSKKNLSDMFFGGKKIAFSSNIVYSAKIIENIDISEADFKNIPSEKLDHTEIADIILHENNMCLFNGDIFLYSNGVYTNHEKFLEQKIIDIYNKATKNMREEVISYLKIKLEDNQLEVNKNYINFKNGLYDIKNKVLIKHTPDIFTINKLPVCYNKNANKNNHIEKFLNEISSCNIMRKEAILQIIGYCMTSSIEFQKAFIFYGKTASNGKSTLLEVINKLIGIDNISHVSIQNLQDKFYASEIQNKLLNSVSELPTLALRTAEIFKSVVTGDRIATERKFKERKHSKLYAKHIFTTNELPKILHTDEGFFRRLNILNFEAQFTMEQKANFLIENLFTAEALEYLVLISVEAYHRLLNKRIFSNEEESEKILGIYKLDNNSALAFLNDTENLERITNNANNEIKQSLLFEEYKRWCKRNGRTFIGRNTFYAEVTKSNLFAKISKRNTDFLIYMPLDIF